MQLYGKEEEKDDEGDDEWDDDPEENWIALYFTPDKETDLDAIFDVSTR